MNLTTKKSRILVFFGLAKPKYFEFNVLTNSLRSNDDFIGAVLFCGGPIDSGQSWRFDFFYLKCNVIPFPADKLKKNR